MFLININIAYADGSVEPDILGAVIQYGPAYQGSNKNTANIIPILSLSRNLFYAQTTEGILEGGVKRVFSDNYSYGVQLAYEDGRTNKGILNGVKILSINPSISYGAFLQYEEQVGYIPIDFVARYRKDIDSARGSQFDLRLTVGIYGGEHEKLNAEIFMQRTFADQKAMHTYYGIDKSESIKTGSIIYSPNGGTLNSRFGIWSSYEFTQNLLLVGEIEKVFLGSMPLHSPIAKKSDSNYISLGVAYKF
jgi:prepilin-type processing-associated H-X9-DG protein